MSNESKTTLPFMKMHGLGNDFVIIDARSSRIELNTALIRAIADRHRGVGFDQLAVILPSNVDAHLDFYNSDGSKSAACGNATRCIARFLMDEIGKPDLTLKTDRGILRALDLGDNITSINMGEPILDWREIPLAYECDTLSLPIEGDPVATGMGNPHCTFFVDDAEDVDLSLRGAEIEHHPLFPERTNVQFASIIGENHIRMRVWERGVGVTLASGSSSCATAVAAARRGLVTNTVLIDLDGGQIKIDWCDDGVWMAGPTAYVFDGIFTTDFLAGVT